MAAHAQHPTVGRLKLVGRSSSADHPAIESAAATRNRLTDDSPIAAPQSTVRKLLPEFASSSLDAGKAKRGSLRRSSNVNVATPQKRLSLVAIFPDTKEGKSAFEALNSAAQMLGYKVESLPFEKIDFGDTSALDKLYSASVAVADVTDRSRQANLFYQLGLRESFDMKQNIVTYVDSRRRGSNMGPGADVHDVRVC